MKKLLRIFTVFILAFGWLFIAPVGAYSDDPITVGAQKIEALNEKISNLNDSSELVSLINIAQDKYDAAVISRDNKISTEQSYDQAVETKSISINNLNNKISLLNTTQKAVYDQTPVALTALTNKNNTGDALDIANINLLTAQQNLYSSSSQGVSFKIYPLSRSGNVAYIAEGSGVMCQGSIPSFDVYSGSGSICGLSENIIGIFKATVTVPADINLVKFAGYTDDGFRLYVDGVLATEQWIEQGATWSPYTHWFNTQTDKTLELEAWWYNGGGPGSMHVGVGTQQWWSGIPSEWLSSGPGPTQEQIDSYNEAIAERTYALEVYNDKLSVYNQEVAILNNLQDDLEQAQEEKNNAQTTYQLAELNTELTLAAKDFAIEYYNNAIEDMNNAIASAEEEYADQWNFEERQRINAAIATALANIPQPQPTAEVTVESTPEPSPEPSSKPTEEPTEEPTPETSSKPIDQPTEDPKPEQTEESTPEPKPTDDPVVEPTEEPTSEPTTEATPKPKPTTNPEINNEELTELVPEKGTGTAKDLSRVIANLTSKDNKLVKLSAEQVAAVSQTLKSLTQEAKAEIAKELGINPLEVAQIAEKMKDNPALASAFVEFSDRAETAGDTPMPFTLADAVTEVQTEAFLADPLGAVFSVDVTELLSNFSELGSDMTDDQREKAQEVIIPVIIASQVIGGMMRRIK